MNPVTLPDGPSLPRFVQGGIVIVAPLWMMRRLRERYGSAFKINVPIFGDAVVISDPAEVKQLFMTSPEIADILDLNLGLVLGPNSFFAISDDAHRKQRKLLSPPFHGRRLRAYEAIIEQEAVREMADWPEGREFATLGPMMRITLNAILRAVFGAEGDELDELRTLLPAMVKLGSRLVALPIPRTDLGRWSPWGRAHAYRREYDAIIDRLIAAARQDPRLDERDDVLALMLQSRYDDGSAMSREADRPRGRRSGRGDEPRGDLRSAAHPADRRPRDHVDHAGLGGRAAAPASDHAAPTCRRGRRRRVATARGHDPGGPAGAARHRRDASQGPSAEPATGTMDTPAGTGRTG